MAKGANRSSDPAADSPNGVRQHAEYRPAPGASRRLREKPEPRGVRTINDLEVRSGHILND